MLRKKDGPNLLPIAEDYFNNIFSSVLEMKALILDSETSGIISICLLYTSPSPRDLSTSRMPSSA